MSYSAGPWEFRQSTERGETWCDIVGALPKELNPLFRDYVITETSNRHHCISPEEDLANARLIASAPKLLHNLKALWHAVAKYDGIGQEGSELLEVMSDARQAIEDAGDHT